MEAEHVSGMANRILWSLIRSQTPLRTLLHMTKAVPSQPFKTFEPLVFRAQLFSHIHYGSKAHSPWVCAGCAGCCG